MFVEIRGVIYPSGRAAARALGVCPRTLYTALDQGRTATVGLYGKAGKPIPVTIQGKNYPSIAAAGRALGMNPDRLRRKLICDPRFGSKQPQHKENTCSGN